MKGESFLSSNIYMIIQIKSDLGSFTRKHKIEKNENLVSKVGM